MKKRLWIIGGLVLMVAVVVAILLLFTGGQENTATIVEVVNKVDAHPRPRDDWEPVVVDMEIYGGGQVRTGTESFARLELLEGIVRLSADSIFTVKESVTRQGTLLTTLFLQEGRLWVHLTSDQPHEFTVETSSAVAAVRDTDFSVRVADGETLISVAEGEVELTAQEQSVTVAVEEQATVEPDQPPSPPEPMNAEERQMWATEGEMPDLAPPIDKVGMGGNLSIRGVVRNSSESVAPDVYVAITVFEEGGGGSMGLLWKEDVLTDETGAYAFNNLLRVEGGHYEVWLNGDQGHRRVYETSGYYINENEINGDVYLLDVTVYPVTGSAFSGVIQYKDADGATENLLSSPGHHIGLIRGSETVQEYSIGSEHSTDNGSTVYFSDLAGGTYYLELQYKKSDRVRVRCTSPSFGIPPGETKQYDYTIPASSCHIMQ
ncbi:MAG: hypothetical protein GY832_41450 [Chloroflexi bacterium]|nr:hypothetical protein [Chloroflexota bacterium]